MRVRDLITIIHRLAPPDLAAEWDNPGLQVGSFDQEITKVGLVLDATPEAVARARAEGCDLLLAHHPLLFKPLKNIDADSGVGAVLKAALQGGLTIVSAHTNWDAAALGVARALADALELTDRSPLEPQTREFDKLVVFVPVGYEARIREAVFAAGAGTVGDYDHTWFGAPGEGGFRAPETGRPFIGQAGSEARARESRLEIIAPRSVRDRVAEAVRRHHPYEEPAFEFHPVRVAGRDQGLGLIGAWDPPRDLFTELRRLSPAFKWAGPRPGRLGRVALLPGSGGSFLHQARRRGAEVLVTGDVSFHQALEAQALGLTLVDLGHFETEWPGVLQMARVLAGELARRNLDLECRVLAQNGPWNYES